MHRVLVCRCFTEYRDTWITYNWILNIIKGQAAGNHCVSLFSSYLCYFLLIFSAIEVYGSPLNRTVKSCEVWQNGRGSCQEGMARIWRRLAKGWRHDKTVENANLNRHIWSDLESWSFEHTNISSFQTSFPWGPVSSAHYIFCKLHFYKKCFKKQCVVLAPSSGEVKIKDLL